MKKQLIIGLILLTATFAAAATFSLHADKTEKTVLVGADIFGIEDSAASWGIKYGSLTGLTTYLQTALTFTTDTNTQLSNAQVETAYNTQVAKVSAGEITAGTETAVRRVSPADVVAIVDAHGGSAGEANETMDSTPTNGNTVNTVSSDGIFDAVLAAVTNSFTGTVLSGVTSFSSAIQALANKIDNSVTISATSPIAYNAGVFSMIANAYQAYQVGTGLLYTATSSATTATGNINIDGAATDHYYFNNGTTAASYTPIITSAPASGKERYIVLTIGGGTGVDTLVDTNITWLSAAAPTLITTTSKKLTFACLIPSSGDAMCNAVGGAHD